MHCPISRVAPFLLVLGLLGLVACDGKSHSGSDASTADGSDTVAPLVCDGDCTDYVTTRLILPTTPQLVQQLGFDFDGDGRKDNGLGTLMASLRSLVDLDWQSELDRAVAGGDAMLIARLKAESLDNTAAGRHQLWLAEEQDCCPTAETLEDCQTEAATSCFSGSAVHRPSESSPDDMIFDARIETGQLSAGPAHLTIRLTFGDGEPRDLVLNNAHVLGGVSQHGIEGGVIAGTISQAMLDDVLIRSLAEVLLEKAKAGGNAGEIITNLFDANEDGTVTLTEISSDELMHSLFTPDVDVDGQPELSLGLGFEAVTARIEPPL